MIKRSTFLALAAFWAAGAAAAACDDLGPLEIYPTARELPENLLRIYVYFPRPMSLDAGVQHIQLLNESGDPVAGVFLDNREDLWSPDRRRLTLLLNPGRVKTGLEAHEAFGRALVPGREYAFAVSGAAKTADGCTLGRDVRHSFTATAADLEPPNPARWSLSVPQAQSTEPLTVALDGPNDHLSLAYRLRVLDVEGAVIPGAIALGPDEESWTFVPSAPWEAAPYQLVVDERLEDLAGNRPGLPFDRPLDQPPLPLKSSIAFTPQP